MPLSTGSQGHFGSDMYIPSIAIKNLYIEQSRILLKLVINCLLHALYVGQNGIFDWQDSTIANLKQQLWLRITAQYLDVVHTTYSIWSTDIVSHLTTQCPQKCHLIRPLFCYCEWIKFLFQLLVAFAHHGKHIMTLCEFKTKNQLNILLIPIQLKYQKKARFLN